MVKRSLFFILIISTLWIAACGKEDPANGTGAAAFHVVWVGSGEHAPNIHRTAPTGVLTVRVIVSAPDMAAMQNDFPAAAGVGTVHGIPAGANRTFTIQGLDANLTPVYQGVAYSVTIAAGQVNDCGTITLLPVTTAAGVTATPGNGQVTVNWNPVSGATSYNIYWSMTPPPTVTTGTKIANAVSPYTHAGLTNGITYYYFVEAVFSGGGTAPLTTYVSASPFPTGTGTTIPSPPLNITATAGDRQITISWNPAFGATSYNLYWSTTALISTATKITNATSPYTLLGLTNGTTYYYFINAVNSYGESITTAPYSATPGVAPSAPTGVMAVAGDGQVAISWNASPNAPPYYFIYWSTAPGVTKTSSNKIPAAVSGSTTYTHPGLTNGTTYYYIITAGSYVGGQTLEGAASAEVSATPKFGATMPLTESAANVTDTSATLNGSFTNPQGLAATTAWLEYGPTASYGTSSGQTVYTMPGNINITASLSGLTEHTTYHYRIVTQNTAGTFYGVDNTFTTLYIARVLVSGLTQPYHIVYDASTSSLFFTQNTSPNGSISVVSTSGTGSVTTVMSSLINPTLLAIDATNVYWVDNIAGGSSTYQINKALKTGGTSTILATSVSSPYDISVDASNVYWTENVGSSGGSVKKVSINGGPVTTLASGLTSPKDLAIDSTNVYWTENAQSIKKVGINGGTPTVLVGLSYPGALADSIVLDQSYIYYIGDTNPAIRYLQKLNSNGGSSVLITEGISDPFILDGTSIYSATSYIVNTSLTDGAITSLTFVGALRPGPGGMAMNSMNIYWTGGSGDIFYVPKN